MRLRFSSLFLSCVLLMAPAISRADDFAPIPAGDAIYEQLSTLSRAAKLPKSGTSLTRYEAALQTARVIFSVSEDERAAAMTREGWKALRDLAGVLKPELKKMEVDATAALALAERALKAPAVKASAPLRATAPLGLPRVAPLNVLGARGAESGGLWNALSPRQGVLGAKNKQLMFLAPLSQRVRVETAILAMHREGADPFSDHATTLASASSLRARGQSATLGYNLNEWLALRATTAERDWSREDARLRAPLLAAPLLAGSSSVQSSGGGVELQLGPALFTTDLERLRADSGTTGTRVAGGVGVSAWQNRLSLSAHLSRLQPDDSTVLASTAAELNLGVDITRRVTLSVLYQGLFTPESQNNASRVGGGLSMSF